jgi:hypothetical protein
VLHGGGQPLSLAGSEQVDVLVSARRIYQAFGFTLVEEQPHHSFGHDLIGQTWMVQFGQPHA